MGAETAENLCLGFGCWRKGFFAKVSSCESRQIFFSQISDDLYQIASPDGGARLLFAKVDSGCGIYQLVAQLDRNGRHIRLCYDDNGLPHSIYDGSGRHFQPVFSSIRLHDNDPDFDPAGERDVFVSEDERFYVNRLTSVTFNGKELVRYGYDGYGDLTAVYGRDGKKLRGFAYRNHIMVEHSQPDGLVSRYEIYGVTFGVSFQEFH